MFLDSKPILRMIPNKWTISLTLIFPTSDQWKFCIPLNHVISVAVKRKPIIGLGNDPEGFSGQDMVDRIWLEKYISSTSSLITELV